MICYLDQIYGFVYTYIWLYIKFYIMLYIVKSHGQEKLYSFIIWRVITFNIDKNRVFVSISIDQTQILTQTF